MFAPSDAVRSLTLTRRCAIKCNALNLSRYWKTGLSAESQPRPRCRGMRLDYLPANGSLSRAAAVPHSAVRGGVAGLIDRESPVLSHTIFRRPLGSRISSVKVLEACSVSYRKAEYEPLSDTEPTP